MDGFILVPERMRDFLTHLIEKHHPAAKSVLAVLQQQAVHLPIEYQFRTDDGDNCRVVAWSQQNALDQIKEDRRFPGNLTLMGTCPAWPGTGVSRITCPDFDEQES